MSSGGAVVGAGNRIPDYETYDFAGAWKGRGLEDEAERRLVEAWAGQGGGACLDIGGGFGRIAEVLEPHFRDVFLLDYSRRNLRTAAATLRKTTTLVRADLEALPFEDGTFDFVALIRVMHHLREPGRVLSEVARVARDGATFVMSDPNALTRSFSRKGREGNQMVGPQGHRIYVSRLGDYQHPSLVREEIRGVGLFDNRVGIGLNRLAPLSALDLRTSRLWPAKANLFIRFRVSKKGTEGETKRPRVVCACGAGIEDGACPRCGRSYGRIIDLVERAPAS